MTTKTSSTTRSRNVGAWLTAVLVVLLLAVGFAARLRIAWLDYRFVLGHTLWSDDSFLCMSIARNLAAGLGMTSDGVHVTNGFQPLYVFLLVPIFWLVEHGDRIAPIHWAGTLQAIFAAGAGWMYYCIARRAFHRSAALFVLFFWAVSHYFVVAESNGMETPVYGFALGLLIWFYLSRFVQSERQGMRAYVGLGALSGLVLLARIDAAFCLLSIALEWLWRNRRSLRRRIVPAGAALAAGLVVLSPWLATCWMTRGTIVPDSGPAVRFISARLGFVNRPNYFDYRGPDAFDPEDAPWQFQVDNLLSSAALWAALTPLTSYLQGTETTYVNNLVQNYPAGRIPSAAPHVSLVAVVLFLIGWVTWPWWRAPIRARLFHTNMASQSPSASGGPPNGCRAGALDFLRLPVLLWIVVYSFHVFGQYYYYRYYYPVIVIFTLFSGWLLDAAVRVLARRSNAARVALLGILASAYGLVFYCQMAHEFEVDEVEMQFNKYLSVVPWIEANIPGDARLGSFQSGVLSYFAPQICINLDGVVNHDALLAMRQRRLWQYIRAQRIDYLVDWSVCLNRYLRPTAGVDPVPLEPVFTTMPMKVYRVLHDRSQTGKVNP